MNPRRSERYDEGTMSGTNGHDGGARLDRIERGLHELTNHISKLAEQLLAVTRQIGAVNDLLSRMVDVQGALADAQKHTDERLNDLISAVNELIRRLPEPPEQPKA